MIFRSVFGVMFILTTLMVGCAKISPPPRIEVSKERLINVFQSLDKAEKDIKSFASKGLLELSHIKGSQELKFYAVGSAEPFRIRLELIAMQGIPISTIIIKDADWIIINYQERTAYIGNSACGQLVELIGICPTKSELYSILLGELVLWEYSITDVDERKAEVSAKLDNDRVISIVFDNSSNRVTGFKDINKDVSVEFYYKMLADGKLKNMVKINSGILNPTVTIEFAEVIKNTQLDSDLFDEQVPNNFKIINF